MEWVVAGDGLVAGWYGDRGGGGVVGYLGEGYRRQVNSGGVYNDGTISRAERGGVEGQ